MHTFYQTDDSIENQKISGNNVAIIDNPSPKDISTSSDFETNPLSNPTNMYNPSFKEEILQWWFGTIVEITDESYIFEMCDLNGKKTVLEFDRDELDKDCDYLELGVRAVYTVTKRNINHGQIQYISDITLDENPAITTRHKKEFEKIISKTTPSVFDE